MAEYIAFWLLAALVLFWFVGAHNRLMRLRSAAFQAYAVLDGALQRQVEFVRARCSDLLPSEDSASLNAAVAQLHTLLATTRSKPLDKGELRALGTALHVLLAAWLRRYPDAVTRFDADGTLARSVLLQQGAVSNGAADFTEPLAWPEPSAAAEIARGQFNLRIAQYNAAIAEFPARWVAWVFGLRAAAPLI